MSVLSGVIGSVISGYIYSGGISEFGVFNPGTIGVTGTPVTVCHVCRRESPYNLYQMIMVPMNGAWDRYFCKDCAGFDWEKKRFYNREDAIRESVPDAVMDLPTEILADWCEDNGRPKDAIYLRELD